MLLEISHRTTYRYDAAPTNSTQVLRLTPRSDASQSVLDWRIDADVDPEPWRDGFGNQCHTLALENPPRRIDIVARGRVSTACTNGVLPPDGCLPELFLPQTFRTRPDREIAEFASGFRGKRLDVLHDLMAAIRDRVVYETGVTNAGSTAAEAFAAGRGVCQDHAHIFIGCARRLGVPARYVSGYLYDGDATHAAGHAWATAWVGDLGWVGFDVSNRICATERHVSLAVGLDYDSASPVRGVRTGGVGEALEVAVRVSAQPLQPGRSRAAGRPR